MEISQFLWYFPSEAHAMAGRRPAMARSERSERSVRKALLQKIELFWLYPTQTTSKKISLTLPNTDNIKKNFFTCPKSHYYIMIINKEYNKKNFFTLESSLTCGWIFPKFWKNEYISTVSYAKLGAWHFLKMNQDPLTPLNGVK